jgi:hypothetical protein
MCECAHTRELLTRLFTQRLSCFHAHPRFNTPTPLKPWALPNSPRFVNYARRNAKTPLDPTTFYNSVKALQSKHLGATLRLLSPVNTLSVFGVSLTTSN